MYYYIDANPLCTWFVQCQGQKIKIRNLFNIHNLFKSLNQKVAGHELPFAYISNFLKSYHRNGVLDYHVVHSLSFGC
ncbi:hypothetical protein TNCV_5030351 [Trichonephila clavipes]|nr:hypothetical protein TNCV_5030351 [Trichonephila clavipes]